MNKVFSVIAAGVMATSTLMAISTTPVEAARMPSVAVTITDEPGYDYCRLAFTVRGLEPNSWYLLYVNGSSSIAPDFWTDAKGAYTQDYFNVDRPPFNETNTITTTLYLTNSGLPAIETRVRVRNSCPATY